MVRSTGPFQAGQRTNHIGWDDVMLRLRSGRTVAAVAVVAGVLLGMSLLEGDVADDLTHFGSLVAGLLNRFGAAASFALLYIEESGVPLPVPGDVYVT